MTTDAPGHRLPSAAEEERFWDLIESAWAGLGPEPAMYREHLATWTVDTFNDWYDVLRPWLPPFLDRLRIACADLSSHELTDLDRVLERRLHDIDRADVYDMTVDRAIAYQTDPDYYPECVDDPDIFLSARGYPVAAGRPIYEAVRADPAMALAGNLCQEMPYFFANLHRDRFGALPVTNSGISRRSESNPSGWPPPHTRH